jgi:ribosomal protein L16 Arg81 hydroxylase
MATPPHRHDDPLAWMLDPIPAASFFDTHWETKPLVIPRAAPAHFGALLTMSEVDRVLTTEPVAHPDVFLVDASRDINADQYTYPSGMINVVRLFQHFANGATIILNQLERHVAPLQSFVRALERTFSTRFQANVYLTPKSAQGFKTHYDSHDVFILQIHGSKRWVLYDTPIRLPMHGQSYERSRPPAGEPTLDFVLHPGDTVYIPRGTMHDARTDQNCDSLHVTVGVMQASWTEVLIEAVAQAALDDPEFRRGLPIGFAGRDFDRTAARRTFQKLLRRFASRADFDAALDHFADDHVATRHSLLDGQLDQVRALDQLSPETIVGVRPNLIYRARETDTHIVVACYGHDVRLPIHAAPAVRFALENERYAVADLPGDLDDPGKVVLVRRFILEGLVRRLPTSAAAAAEARPTSRRR